MSDEIKNPRPDKAQIEKWKKEHGEIFEISVDDKSVIVRKPKLKDMEVAMASSTSKPMNFNKSILNNCKLWADEEIFSNDDLFLAACGKLDEVVKIKDAEIKKL